MHKRLLIGLLLPGLLLALTACGRDAGDRPENSAAPETAVEAVQETPPPPLLYLNDRPALDAPLQRAAEAYSAQSGVEVRVRTVQDADYKTALAEALEGEDAPAIFLLDGLEDPGSLGELAAELEGSALAGRIPDESFRLRGRDGALRGLGFCRESFGLIVNTALLEQAGFHVEDLVSFDTLKPITDSIHIRAAELKFEAFTVSGFWDVTPPRISAYLLNLPLFYELRDRGLDTTPERIEGSCLPYFHRLWDSMIFNCVERNEMQTSYTDADALEQFISGKAVFHLDGSWVYDTLAERMDASALQMLPLYCGVPGEEQLGLSSGCRSFWALNAALTDERRQQALDFLCWLTESPEGLEALSATGAALPFEGAAAPSNPFCRRAEELHTEGRYNLDWVFRLAPGDGSWREIASMALARYSMDGTDPIWQVTVPPAFIDGWFLEYAIQEQ